MLIGIYANTFADSYRGIAIYLDNILKYLAKNDLQNKYILYLTREPRCPLNYSDSFSVKIIPGVRRTYLWAKLKLPKVLKNDGIDLFWNPDGFMPGKVNGIKYVSTVHDLLPVTKPNMYPFWSIVVKNYILVVRSYKRADRLIAISDYTAKELVRICNIKKEKIIRIYNGNGDARKSTTFNQLNVLNGFKIFNKYFLYVGAIGSNSNKNIETIIKAFNILAKKNNAICLVLAGKANDIQQLCIPVSDEDIRNRVIFTGYITNDERDILYTNAVSAVFPTLGEGFGLPILEAMNCGTPIIVSSNTCLTEVGGDAAIYLENERDEFELAEKMEWVLNLSDEERQKIVQKGYEQSSKFSWNKCAEETLKVLTENW